MAGNDKVGVCFAQPKTLLERNAVAAKCCAALQMSMPLLVDTMDDRVGHLYSGMPDRLYVIDTEGKVAYQGGRGPFGFRPGEMEQELALLLLAEGEARKQPKARFPLLSDADAWARLPAAEKGQGTPLPVWARALAHSLPRTAAAMLELDWLHRAGGYLEPRLRAAVRWAAANANGCAWSEAQALADLRRAGVADETLKALGRSGRPTGLAGLEMSAMRFARRLTLEAHRLRDLEVQSLLDAFGERRVVAMVQLVAYANFQDRLLLSLGVRPEEDEPPPPLEIRFRKGAAAAPAPQRKAPEAVAATPAVKVEDREWLALSFDDLQRHLAGQRARKPRIRVPVWEEVKKVWPGEPPARPVRIQWSLVCAGYQPELAQGWGACTRAFGQEARQDRVFEECLFWVVTRTIECFY
jgi:alkylhydroperoxidase family enzyme